MKTNNFLFFPESFSFSGAPTSSKTSAPLSSGRPRAAQPHPEARHHLVEDQQRAVPITDLAQARQEGLTLVTRDSEIRRYDVTVLGASSPLAPYLIRTSRPFVAAS